VVRQDEHLSATAIRTCVEPDAKPGVLTVRVANNRPFAQHLTVTPKGSQWAWVWNGDADLSPTGFAWAAAHLALDTKSALVMPPTKTMAFGVARPSAPGFVQFGMTAKADAATIFMDLIGMTIDNLAVGGLNSPVLNAFLQAIYECGGKQLLASRPGDDKDAAVLALKVAQDCVTAMVDPAAAPELSHAVVNAYENALRNEIARAQKAGDNAALQNAIKAGRLTHEISSRLKYLAFFEIADYVSNQLADALVGPTTITVQLSGTAQKLGAWTPTCTDAGKDDNALFRNVALQDKYANTSKELWQYPSWAADAATAVRPLTKCSAAQREAVAKSVDTSWADHKAAAVVARAIRALTAGGATIIRTVDPWHDGTAAKAVVSAAGSGASCSVSEIAPRRDAFRCFAESILDPCFANPAKNTEYLCAPLTLTGKWTRLTGAPRDGGFVNPGTPGQTGIFLAKLANGADCRRSTGAGPNGVPGYPYWAGGCNGQVWRVADGMADGSTYPLFATGETGQWAAAVETSPRVVKRLPVTEAWR
jgi:hypothetical protein